MGGFLIGVSPPVVLCVWGGWPPVMMVAWNEEFFLHVFDLNEALSFFS